MICRSPAVQLCEDLIFGEPGHVHPAGGDVVSVLLEARVGGCLQVGESDDFCAQVGHFGVGLVPCDPLPHGPPGRGPSMLPRRSNEPLRSWSSAVVA